MGRVHRVWAYGFTLIELMITVAVLGVLAAIAIPTYQDYVLTSNRSKAKAALQEGLNRQERFYTTNNTYTDDLTQLGYNNDPASIPLDAPANDTKYQLSACQCGGTCPGGGGTALDQCVRLSATPDPGSTQTRDTCGTYWLNSRGQRGVTGSGDCW